jgi:diguanylate cyclase (GGDEF)-like protein
MRTTRNKKFVVYLCAVTVAGWAALLWIIHSKGTAVFGHSAVVWVLAPLVVLGELFPIRVQRGDAEDELSVSTPFSLSLLVLAGLGPAAVVQAVASAISDVVRQRPLSRALFNVAQYTLSLVVAWTAIDVAGTNGFRDRPLAAGDIGLLVLSAAAFFACNNTLPAVAQALYQRLPVWRYLIDDLLFQLGVAGALFGMVPLVIATAHISLPFVPLVLLPLGAVYKSASDHAKTAYEATHDSLTGLPNRAAFTLRLHEVLEAAEHRGQRSAVVLVDLDRFKEVNDTLGHAAGDQLLQGVGARLRALVRPSDQVARLGGDEFAIVLPDLEAHEVEGLATRVLTALERPFAIEEANVDTDASLGIALVPMHGSQPNEVFRHADVALYEAKRTHAGYTMYDPLRDQTSQSRVTLLRELKRALALGQFVTYFQPKASMDTGEVIAVEALVRWQHPTNGLLMPDTFIPLVEQSGLSRQFTLHVLTLALEQQDAWSALGLDIAVAVNLTVRNLHDGVFPREVGALLASRGPGAGRVQFEITEGIIMADPVRVTTVLSGLRDSGVTLSLDDFGTGYSSLSHLAELDIDEIKIDKSFVLHMGDNEVCAAIVRSTVDLARNLGLRSVAEGVEDEETWLALRSLGCDEAQGFYVSRPQSADELTAWLTERASIDLRTSAEAPAAPPHRADRMRRVYVGGSPAG